MLYILQIVEKYMYAKIEFNTFMWLDKLISN